MATFVHKVYLGLGSNQGDRNKQLARAIELIGERVGKVIRQSSIIETEPWGFTSGNKFLNCAIFIETELLSPNRLSASWAVAIKAWPIAIVLSTSTSCSTMISHSMSPTSRFPIP